jgi:hypothetical protein
LKTATGSIYIDAGGKWGEVNATAAVVAIITAFSFAFVPTALPRGSFDYPVERVIFYPDTDDGEKAKVYALVIEAETEKEALKIVKKITKTWNRREKEYKIYLKTLERTWYLTVSPIFTYHHKDDISDHGDYPPMVLPLKPSEIESDFVLVFKKENGDEESVWEVIVYVRTPLMDDYLWDWQNRPASDRDRVSITNKWSDDGRS